MAVRRMRLRYAGPCAVCRSELGAGVEAVWDGERRTVTCLDCAVDPTATVRSGTAGGSARAEADRLRAAQAARHRRMKEQHPILGRLALALADEPPAGASWAKGAVGEEKLGAALDRLEAEGLCVLHDRRLPGSKANIDHLVVAPTGVWVIDAKRYAGRVQRVDKGGWCARDVRLVVAGRDRTKLIAGVLRQVGHVEDALAPLPGAPVPVHGALCFLDAEFGLFAKPFTVQRVVVAWGRALRKRLVAPGPMPPDRRAAVHRHLARSFPPAT